MATYDKNQKTYRTMKEKQDAFAKQEKEAKKLEK